MIPENTPSPPLVLPREPPSDRARALVDRLLLDLRGTPALHDGLQAMLPETHESMRARWERWVADAP